MTRPSVILETDTDRHQSLKYTISFFPSLSYVSRFPGKKDVSFILSNSDRKKNCTKVKYY